MPNRLRLRGNGRGYFHVRYTAAIRRIDLADYDIRTVDYPSGSDPLQAEEGSFRVGASADER